MIDQIRTVIDLDLSGGHQVAEHVSARNPWAMRVENVEITYVWTRYVGYWRVVQSVIRGIRRYGDCPSEYTYPRMDVDKPLWLAALEHRHYPGSVKWNM